MLRPQAGRKVLNAKERVDRLMALPTVDEEELRNRRLAVELAIEEYAELKYFRLGPLRIDMVPPAKGQRQLSDADMS